MLDKKGGMKSEIKITGLIKSGGQRVVIKGKKGAAEEVLKGNVKLKNLYANAKIASVS
jgi:hypothetical protein